MTLTQTAILVKQLITVSAIAIILGIAGFIGYRIGYANYLANLPPVEGKPDTKFGMLPLPDFPKSSVSSSNYTYSLDTTTGGLPKIGIDPGFEKIIKVYFVTQTFATFLSPDKSTALSEKFGIKTIPNILSETKYQFKDKGLTLIVNLNNGNFSYTNDATISAKQILDEDNKLVSGFKQTLSTLDIIKDDLKDGRNKVMLLRPSGNDFIPTNVRTEAEAALISLWPADIDKKPIIVPEFNKSLINAIVIKTGNTLEDYLSLNFTYYPIDTTTFATYPIKTAEMAFEDLKSGKGVVIIEPGKPQVSITSVYLGYYLAENYSPYLQPIYVFEGPDFVSYISAIPLEFQSTAKQN